MLHARVGMLRGMNRGGDRFFRTDLLTLEN